MANTRIAICLFESDIKDLNSTELLAGGGLKKVDFLNTIPVEASLFVKESELSLPEWVGIIETFGEIETLKLKTASSGAILLLKINDRIIACCFGTSVANINRNSIETDFGLGVVFQQMLKSQTKSVESFALSNNPITNFRSATIPTSRVSFNIDDYLESITELTGYFYRDKRRTLIKGKEFYSTICPISIDKIITLCNEILIEYNLAKTNPKFLSLTSTRKVKDKLIINTLDKDLCKAFNDKSDTLFIVDYESFDNLDGYRLSLKGQKFEELTTEDVLNSFQKKQIITLDFLKNKRIYPCDNSEQALANWSLYRSVFIEFIENDCNYVLYKGNWYEIDKTYLDSLRDYIKLYEEDYALLPKWNGSDDEGVYNQSGSAMIGGQCWDKVLYVSDEYNYGIEFCDILHNNNIIHVKKYSSSSLNSHLFLQTAVSAQLLAYDPKIKKWISETSKNKFKNNQQLLNKKLEFKNSEIVYYIILMTKGKKGKKSVSEMLPFFSLVSFNIVIKKIAQLGYKVKIGKV